MRAAGTILITIIIMLAAKSLWRIGWIDAEDAGSLYGTFVMLTLILRHPNLLGLRADEGA